MKSPLLAILLALCAAASAAPVEKLRNFELSDQHESIRSYRFPKAKVTVMTIADHKGSEQLAPWIQRIRDRYETRIDIDGVADMSSVPGILRGTIRDSFRKKLTYSVMLDWGGDVVKQFGYAKGVANIYVIDREGRIVAQVTGLLNDKALQTLTREIERAIAPATNP
jgi:hypothetical protein